MSVSPESIEVVSQRLDRFVADRRAESADWGTEARDFVDAAANTLVGGKRLRALFAITGWQCVSTSALSPAAEHPIVGVAAALEVFQAAALVHDDIIDRSDTRRGRPSAHRLLEAAHRTAGWQGSAQEHGTSAALLLGDLLVAWSDDLFEEAIQSAPHAASARAEYARMRRYVTVGQYLDIAEEAAYATAPDADQATRALRIASMKSARYSVQQPLLIGAAVGGATPEQLETLSSFGHDIGIAFQLRDDVLGVFGDSAITGKPSGDDLREGKRTLLIAYTREKLDASARGGLDALIGDATLTDAQITHTQQLIRDTGALDRVEHDIALAFDRADSLIVKATHLQPGLIQVLRTLADRAVRRTV